MEKKQVNENRMGTQPLLGLILKMSIPAMFSMMIQALYNIVDSYYVGMIADSVKPLAAVSLAFPVQTLMVAFAMGTAIGTGSLISRRLGEKKRKEAETVATNGIAAVAVLAAVFAILGGLFSKSFISMFESDAEIVEMGASYISICCIFCLPAFMEMCFQKVFQSTGNMMVPMISQIVGALTNIILDPFFIFGWFGLPAMGVTGAAVATVIGQTAAMLVGLAVILAKKAGIHISFKHFRFKLSALKNIYSVGLPTIVMQSIGTVMTISMNAILVGFSVEAYTVFGLFFKLQSFVFMPLFGLMQGLMPIMAYNYGASNKKRVLGALKYGVVIALIVNTAGFLLFNLVPGQLLSIFNDTEEILAIGIPALRILSISFIPAAISITIGTLYQAVGRGVYSMINSVSRQLGVLVPVAWLMARLTGQVNFVWWAFPIADAVSLCIVLFFLSRILRNELSGSHEKAALAAQP